MDNSQRDDDKTWVDTTATVAPCLMSAAAGVFLGDLIQRKARGPVALVLVSAGVAALTPSVSLFIREKIVGPKTRRGSNRTLESIRGAGASVQEFEDEKTSMYVG